MYLAENNWCFGSFYSGSFARRRDSPPFLVIVVGLVVRGGYCY